MAFSQPTPPDQPPSRPVSRGVSRALVWPVAAVGLGALLIHNSLTGSADPKSPAAPAAVAPPAVVASPTPGPTGLKGPAKNGLRRSVPRRIVIPQIRVNAPFTPLSVSASGQLNAPPVTNKNLVGWYKDGVSPGERGASIVVGHVDTKSGPAVFVLLRTLVPGSGVEITRADGSVAVFTVDSVETFSKNDFPDARVYGRTPTPQLRLITCGGAYNRSAHDYESNVVVFAHLDSVRNIRRPSPTTPPHTRRPASPTPSHTHRPASPTPSHPHRPASPTPSPTRRPASPTPSPTRPSPTATPSPAHPASPATPSPVGGATATARR
ncbi:class F sortase [Streptomyces macrolidinus]|uniref:class F sortase n=1 Tax=Streptomyces macrolidinus TaxID=2952607 RepID=UPI0035573738